MVLYPHYMGGERVEIGILEAAASGNVSMIQRWLEDGGDANEEITAGPWDYPRANLLHHVASVLPLGCVGEEGRLAIVRLLLAHGANANAIANRPSRRRLALGRAPPGDGLRRASPTRSLISCASSGWGNRRAERIAMPPPTRPRAIKYPKH